MSIDASADTRTDLEIAIIGMAGRFPGSPNIQEFWKNLRQGKESIAFFSDEEMEKAGVDRSLLKNPYYIRAGTVLEDADKFDAGFFGYSPRDAELIDPQQRLFLESAYQALEDAGYDSFKYSGLIGVYAGTSVSTYLLNLLAADPAKIKSIGNYSALVANDKDYLTTRLSYKLNLRGPSINIQTACSTSLVAVHIACQSLLSGDCDLALAGGICVSFPQITGYLYEPHGIHSSDGHCRAFDAKASGTILGSGVGIVVLKRLNEALADRDFIYAVIKGSALNNDGSQKVGFTAPRVDGQAAVIESAQSMAGVDPESITYVETHGTGTELGDPIEIAALTQAFRRKTSKKGFCAIGSLKSNIGHTDAAAGIAALIKTALSLHHKEIPASLHFENPNPKIDFGNSPFHVTTTLKKWVTDGIPRRAGVSSFGIGGTNAHAILEEAPPRLESGRSRRYQLALLSAKSSEALEAASESLARHVKENPESNLADLTYTLKIGRRAYPHRLFKVCLNSQELGAAFEAQGTGLLKRGVAGASQPPTIFMFTGQGAQHVNMGFDLYCQESIFRRHVDQCCELLIPHLEIDLRKILFPPEEEKEQSAELMQQTWLAQPALFAIEFALAHLWMHWGLKPWAMIGHSIGEYVAACIAGVFSLEDALRLISARGRLMQSCLPGAMLAVPLPENSVMELLRENIALAAVNAPSLCVLSGPTQAIEELEHHMKHEGLEARRLRTSHAFHSAMMEPILDPFEKTFDGIKLNQPKLPFISNLSGTWITPEQATHAAYWVNHLRHTVRFSNGVQVLLEDPTRVLLEVGPGQTLASLAGLHSKNLKSQRPLPSLRRADDNQPDDKYILETLGMLWLKGIDFDWQRFYEAEERYRIPLPTYPFQRQRFWIDTFTSQSPPVQTSSSLERKADIGDWLYLPSWKRMPPRSSAAPSDNRNCWLMFLDECGVGVSIMSRLEQCGQEVISVRIGQRFESTSETHYTLRPAHREDYEALLNRLQILGKVPQKIVHLWTVTSEVLPQLTAQTFNAAQERGLYSLLYLAQALSRLNVTHPIALEVVSNGLHEVTSAAELVCAEKATLLGPCKVIPQEMPNITCRSIDIGTDSVDETIGSGLLAEMASLPTDRVVAYRGRHRWAQIFEPVRVAAAEKETRRIREKGVYLITGGLGEAGLAFAEALARCARARLVLVGRTGLPAHEEWQYWLTTHDETDGISRKIRRIRAMEDLGAVVSIECADVASEEQMRAVVLRSEKRFGIIHGVVHAAGLLANALIMEIDADLCQQQFHAKVGGLLVLKRILEGRRLDFCLLNSSLCSVLGGQGLVAYTAAHLFVDAFAHQQDQKDSTLWMSIAWDRWQSGGKDPNEADSVRRLTESAITPGEAGEVFLRLLSLELCPMVAVSTSDLEARIDQWLKLDALQTAERTVQVESISLHSRPTLSNAYVPPTNPVERTVAEIFQQLLGIDKIGIHDNFFDLGGHSLLGTQLLSRIRIAFHTQVSLRSLYEGPTAAALAEIISRQQIEQKRHEQMEILREIEQLAEEEVEAELKKSEKPDTGADSA